MNEENNKNQAEEIIDQIKELVKKGNVARVLVIRGEETILNIPLNAGVVGTILGLTAAPWALLASAVAALGFDCRVVIVKTDGEIKEIFSRDVGRNAVSYGSTVIEEIKENLRKDKED